MADDRWQNDDEYARRQGRQYGYDDDNDQRWNREQHARHDEPPRNRGERANEYSSIPGIGVNYGGGQWINEYATDWRRYADRDYPPEREQSREREYRGDSHRRDYGVHDERGWWDRTKDEVRSWMGDTDAEHRRQADHRGRGPKGYTRSDDRIREDVSDRLMEDWGVDATDIEVLVQAGEVTLSGTVDGRESKRRAENIAATVLGVQDVQNNLRVRKPGFTGASENAATSQSTAAPAGGADSTSPGTKVPRH